MRVELVTIGDELLLGFTVDTNAAEMARALAAAGIEIARRTTVGDRADEIVSAVHDALERTGAVVTTGGLGPTSDDLTKPSIARLFGREMRLDPEILAELERRWKARFDRPLPAPNAEQAMVPDGALILHNHHGSAPGIWLEDDRGRWVAMLPGVPREMRGMLHDTLLPLLGERAGADASTVVRSLTLRTTGIAESALAERLGDLARGVPGLPLAYLPSPEGVDLRLTARGLPAGEAERRLREAADRLRERVGDRVYGEDGADLAAVVLDRCRARGFRIATAESCTGGLIAVRLTNLPGSSDVVQGGVVAYDNAVKTSLLGVDAALLAAHGAVSEPVALRMAAGVRVRLGTDVGVGVTGIAGPGGGTPEKPVGTVWIAADVQGTTLARRFHFIGDREEVRRRAAQAALDMLRHLVA